MLVRPFKVNGVSADIVNLTPEIAELGLSLDTKFQRTINKKRIQSHIRLMESGNWTISSDAISIITIDGVWHELVNGQHRLKARLEYEKIRTPGMPDEFPVLLMVSPKSRTLFGIDEKYLADGTGRPKSLGDLLKAAGVPDYHAAAAVVNACLTFEHLGHYTPHSKTVFTRHEQLAWYENRDVNAFSTSYANAAKVAKVARGVGMGKSLIWAANYICATMHDPERAQRFFYMLGHPDGAVQMPLLDGFYSRLAFWRSQWVQHHRRQGKVFLWETLMLLYSDWCRGRQEYRSWSPSMGHITPGPEEEFGDG